MHRILAKDPDHLSRSLAEWIIAYVRDILKQQSRFTIALSGGNTPQLLYGLLASDEFKERIPWEKIHVFWGDERWVPFEDERNNAGMAYKVLLDHVPVQPKQVHRINTDIATKEACKAYEKILRKYFSKSENSFDLVLLGLGKDGHTLSLFPGSNVILEKKAWVCPALDPVSGIPRITLTPLLVNQANRVAFLVTGKEKYAALRNACNDAIDPMECPARSIRPLNNELYWFADEEAVGDTWSQS